MAMRRDNETSWLGVAARFLRAAHEDVSSVLLAVGAATPANAARAAISSTAATERVLPHGVWLGALAVAMVDGFCTMWAAVWVAANAARRRTAGLLVILCAAFVPLVVTVALSGDALELALGIVDAML